MPLLRPSVIWVAAMAIALDATLVLAISLEVVNHGFEDISGESPFNEFTFGELNGWELYDPNNVTDNGDGPTYFIGTLTPFQPDPVGNPGVFANFPSGAAEGQRVGIAFNFNGSESEGEYGFFQELGATLQPHTTYTLEVEIGNIDSAVAMNGAFFPLEGFPGYRVELHAGDTMLEQDNNSLVGTIPDGEFATSVITYTTGASHEQFDENLGILLVNLNQADPSFPASDIEVDFDNVRLDASPTLGGDFDGDLDVDGADFLVWQRDTTVGSLSEWQNGYGMPLVAATLGVPEPAGLLVLVCFSLGIAIRRSR